MARPANVPPRVDYALTPLGRTLLEPVTLLATWAQGHRADILRARGVYQRAAARAASKGTVASRLRRARRFCPVCGSTVFHTEKGVDGHVSVAVGAFTDPSFPAPRDSVYDCRRHPWVQLPAGVTSFDRDPD